MVPALLLVCIGCHDRSDDRPTYETWITEPEYEFGDDPSGQVLLSQVPYLRVAPDGSRVFVIDLVDVPVSGWTPDGTVVFTARRGEGPGGFVRPTRIYIDDDYALPKSKSSQGHSDHTSRRILLPHWMSVHDATDSHAWGIRRDATGVPRIVGRRMVPMDDGS